MGSSPKTPKKTQEQFAVERRQRMALDEETASSERRLKGIAQAKTGKQSLLKDAVKPVEDPAGPTVTPGYMIVDPWGGTQRQKSIFGFTRGAANRLAAKKAAKKQLVGRSSDAIT